MWQEYYKRIPYVLNPDPPIVYILPYLFVISASILPSFLPPFLSSIHLSIFFFLNHLRVSWRLPLTRPLQLKCVFPKNKDILLYNHSKLLKPENSTLIQYF